MVSAVKGKVPLECRDIVVLPWVRLSPGKYCAFR
jgi:hypothetical protein